MKPQRTKKPPKEARKSNALARLQSQKNGKKATDLTLPPRLPLSHFTHRSRLRRPSATSIHRHFRIAVPPLCSGGRLAWSRSSRPLSRDSPALTPRRYWKVLHVHCSVLWLSFPVSVLVVVPIDVFFLVLRCGRIDVEDGIGQRGASGVS